MRETEQFAVILIIDSWYKYEKRNVSGLLYAVFDMFNTYVRHL